MLRNRSADAPARRPAFTLVELLVVMAIILVLAALTLGAIVGLISNQQQAVTEDLFRTVDTKLRQHWNYVIKQAKDEAKSSQISTGVQLLAGYGTNSYSADRALVIHTKLRLMQAFPQSFADIKTPPYFGVTINGTTYDLLVDVKTGQKDLRATATYRKTFKADGYKAASHKPVTESSACLLLALTYARPSTESQLKTDSIARFIADTDGDNIPEIVDGWGTTLQFVRFPNGNNVSAALMTEINGLAPQGQTATVGTVNDPLDPKGTLQVPAWYGSTLRKTFESILSGSATNSFAISGQYSVPFVQSAGPDLTINTTDDLYSFRLRIGGHGD